MPPGGRPPHSGLRRQADRRYDRRLGRSVAESRRLASVQGKQGKAMKIIRVCNLVLIMLGIVTAAAADEVVLLEQARGVAASVPPRLLAVLQQEIQRGGFAGAIGACRDEAPRLAQAASAESGWSIRRVSLRNRNPGAVPDAWERVVLQDFDRRAATGDNPASLEQGEIVTEAGIRVYRYMKALPTQPLCLGCHGTAADISAPVRARLAELYPDDQATGYAVGQIRGAMTLRRPL